jgi:predicted dehydrogenase
MKRRAFLQAAATAAVGLTIVPRHVLGQGQTPPSEQLSMAWVGAGGQGGGLLNDAAFATVNVAALCDVDWSRAAGAFKKCPKARQFKDYRRLLDKAADFDAVVVATPDHMHAPIALAAMRAGKHVYVEKPLAHSVEECRVLARVAREAGLVTQMGNMGHGGEGIRLTREFIQAGAIGTVTEVHSWSDRPGKWWTQNRDRPTDTPPVPADLDWELWLGGAPKRPYHPWYVPVSWRGWFDFGTGAVGDMAVHNMDPAFYALDLDAPTAVQTETSPVKPESYPEWQIVTWEFPARGDRPAVKVKWYDGGKMPPSPNALADEFKLGDNGIYFVGDKGIIQCDGWSGAPRLFPKARRAEFTPPAKSIPRSVGHRAEFVQAVKDRKPDMAKSGFAYAGPFTEALLVGVLATRLGKRIEWDAAKMKATNAPEADAMIRKTYRAGHTI